MNKYGELRKPDDARNEISWYWPKYKRIFDEATATTSSTINLLTQYCVFSVELFASPSAVLKSVCITSPPKLWNSLSKTCQRKANVTSNLSTNFKKRVSVKYYSIVNDVRTGTCTCNRPISCTRLEQKGYICDEGYKNISEHMTRGASPSMLFYSLKRKG